MPASADSSVVQGNAVLNGARMFVDGAAASSVAEAISLPLEVAKVRRPDLLMDVLAQQLPASSCCHSIQSGRQHKPMNDHEAALRCHLPAADR